MPDNLEIWKSEWKQNVWKPLVYTSRMLTLTGSTWITSLFCWLGAAWGILCGCWAWLTKGGERRQIRYLGIPNRLLTEGITCLRYSCHKLLQLSGGCLQFCFFVLLRFTRSFHTFLALARIRVVVLYDILMVSCCLPHLLPQGARQTKCYFFRAANKINVGQTCIFKCAHKSVRYW